MSLSKKNIVLIGYRGVGKSYVSKKLHDLLGMQSFSSDEVFEKKEGLSIGDFVKERGWEAFREAETEIICELSKKKEIVIDCGGGVVEKETNMTYLKNNSLIFYLSAKADDIIERMKLSNLRPSLLENFSLEEETKLILEKRIPLYERYNDYLIDTEGIKIFDAHKEIARIYLEDKSCG